MQRLRPPKPATVVAKTWYAIEGHALQTEHARPCLLGLVDALLDKFDLQTESHTAFLPLFVPTECAKSSKSPCRLVTKQEPLNAFLRTDEIPLRSSLSEFPPILTVTSQTLQRVSTANHQPPPLATWSDAQCPRLPELGCNSDGIY